MRPGNLHGANQVMAGTVLPRPDVEAIANGLPAMLDRAAATLASAKSAAEVLDARDIASVVYDAAKRTARIVAARRIAG